MWWLALQQSHENFKTASLHGDQAPYTRRHAFGVFQKKQKSKHEQKQLLKTTTLSNVSALRAPFLVTNHIAKAEEPFTVAEELILHALRIFVMKF